MGETAGHHRRRRVRGAAARWLLAGAVLLASAEGCARTGGGNEGGTGAVGTAQASADVGALGISCTEPGFAPDPRPTTSDPSPQPLPADFRPVTASRCQFGSTMVPGDGEWQTREEQRADSGLDTLAAALRQPSQTDPKGNCDLVGMLPVVITLTDAHGRKVVPALPRDPCGKPLLSVARAIRELPWRPVHTTRLRRTRSQLEIDSGCPGQYKPMIAIEAAEPPRSANPAPAGPDRPPALEVCRYRLDPAQTLAGTRPSVVFHLGVLTSAGELSGATLDRFLTAVRAAPPVTARCDHPEAPFAVVSGKGGTGPDLTVELGGCLRADVGNAGLRQLDAATVALLNL